MVASSCLVPDFTGVVVGDGRYTCVERIASGAFGVVYRAIGNQIPNSTNTSPIQYAIKILPKFNPKSPSEEKLFHALHQREIFIHSMVSSHDNVVTLYEAFEDSKFRFMVLDYCQGPNLHRFLWPKPLWRNDAKVKDMFLQILDAVGHMHSVGVFHRDLKPENILCSSDGEKFYVTDFGLSTDNVRSSTIGWGTANYMSPECMNRNYQTETYCTSSADVWSLGIILLDILFSDQPWDIATPDDANFYDYTTDTRFYFRYRYPISRPANALILGMLHMNPSARLNIEEIKAAVAGIDTFFMTDQQLLGEYGTIQNRHVARACGRGTPFLVVIPKALPKTKTKSIGPPPVLEIDIACVKMPSFSGTFGSLHSTEDSRAQMRELGLFATTRESEGEAKEITTSEAKAAVLHAIPRQLLVVNNTSGSESDGLVTPETHPVDPDVYGDSMAHLPNPYDDLELTGLDIGEVSMRQEDDFNVKKILDTPPMRQLPARCACYGQIPEAPVKKTKWYARDFKKFARRTFL